MKLRVLGTLLGRRDDAQYNRVAREESRFREAECDNYPATAPVAAEYHHGFEHCIGEMQEVLSESPRLRPLTPQPQQRQQSQYLYIQ